MTTSYSPTTPHDQLMARAFGVTPGPGGSYSQAAPPAAAAAGVADPVTVAKRVARLQEEAAGLAQLVETQKAEESTVTEEAAKSYHRRAANQLAAVEDHLGYWQRVQAEQEARGVARTYTREDLACGDQVRLRGLWWTIVEVGSTTCNGTRPSTTGAPLTRSIPFSQIGAHHRA